MILYTLRGGAATACCSPSPGVAHHCDYNPPPHPGAGSCASPSLSEISTLSFFLFLGCQTGPEALESSIRPCDCKFQQLSLPSSLHVLRRNPSCIADARGKIWKPYAALVPFDSLKSSGSKTHKASGLPDSLHACSHPSAASLTAVEEVDVLQERLVEGVHSAHWGGACRQHLLALRLQSSLQLQSSLAQHPLVFASETCCVAYSCLRGL